MDPRVKQLLQLPENKECADCREPKPRWCSVSLGVVICAECAGIHRKLGTHISFVQSATLDTWKDPWVDKLAKTGNAVAADLYETRLPAAWTRPKLVALGGDRLHEGVAAHAEQFIRAKYELKLFAPYNPQKLLDEAIRSFYERMKEEQLQDRRRREAASVEQSAARRNRQNLYIDAAKRQKAEAASRAFAAKQEEWYLEGSEKRLTAESLASRLALQHFMAVDLEDLSLPAESRLSNDAFDCQHEDVNEQFIKDATRSDYCICGQEFSYAGERLEGNSGVGVAEESSAQMQQRSSEFTARLVSALRSGLGQRPAPLMLRSVSSLMSQSGMAHLERACSSPAVAVSGGAQKVRYELSSSGENSWEIRLTLSKSGFSQAVVYEKEKGDVSPKTVAACSSESRIAKSCTVRLGFGGATSSVVDVDVLDMEDTLCLIGDDEQIRHREPLVDSFTVLLRRAADKPHEPLGLSPDRGALRRGVLRLARRPAPGSDGSDTPASAWNEAYREEASRQLAEGDIIVSINGIPVTRDVATGTPAALAQLKQEQAVLQVHRLRAAHSPGLSYERLLVSVYVLFNPSKLLRIPGMLAKESARSLFLRVAAKYAVTADDWHDLLRCFKCSTREQANVVARADARLRDLQRGQEPTLLEALCKRLLDVPFCAPSPSSADAEATDVKEETLMLEVVLGDRSAPLGLRHDRQALSEKRKLVVTEVVNDSAAAVAGLRPGDIIETVGGQPAGALVLGGGRLTSAADESGTLKLAIRREAPGSADASPTDKGADAITATIVAPESKAGGYSAAEPLAASAAEADALPQQSLAPMPAAET
eukprot:TRINITY_DN24870_c0_g1_i3.p1 TRINITY_DN24870_c0_g1~~TRINITY_DN24870_c0_g1_i3.p1  ORF type:complete len:832 (+),score=187.78 TRINITY_DN24870_c0_g1_i3:32-2497(+)